MAYTLNQGDLKPDMLITLQAPGAIAALPTATSLQMLWTRPDGSVALVQLQVVSAGDGVTPGSVTGGVATGAVLKRVWVAGDTTIPGLHRGTVIVDDVASRQTSDPNDGSLLTWYVFELPAVTS